MTLKGEARTRYMRDYMRRKRAQERAEAPSLTRERVKPTPASGAAKDVRIRELEALLIKRYRAGMKAGLEVIQHLKAENAAMKVELAKLRGEGQVTRSHREERSRPVEFTEVGRLRAEIGRLKSDIIKLRMMLQEEPDATKLRK